MNKHFMAGAGLAAIMFVASGPAMAAGGSGGGGGAGGGGATAATPKPCGNLTLTTSLSSLGAAQVSGTTEKTCDGLTGLVIRFTDTTPTDSCSLTIPDFIGATYFKYGVRPPSRYASGIYAYGACAGTSHALSATLSLNGVDLSTATTTYTA
jgi:hypothetical protein